MIKERLALGPESLVVALASSDGYLLGRDWGAKLSVHSRTGTGFRVGASSFRRRHAGTLLIG